MASAGAIAAECGQHLGEWAESSAIDGGETAWQPVDDEKLFFGLSDAPMEKLPPPYIRLKMAADEI